MITRSQRVVVKHSEAIEEGVIPVTGGNVWYRITGKHLKGTTLLVVHGGPGASHDYLEPLAALADERPVVFYDQLGCGHSDNPGDPGLWTIERYVEELHQVRQALGLDRVLILGQSWGAALAVDYLLTKGSQGVAGVVLSGPLLSTSRWIKDQRAHIAQLPQAVQKVIIASEDAGDYRSPAYQEAMMAFYKIHVCRLDTWPECLNRSFEKLNFPLYEHMWGPSEFTVTGTLKHYERVDRLKEITIPVLFTCGFFDEATPDTTRHYRDHLPGSQMLVLMDAAHEHHLEAPEAYLEAVRAFFHSSGEKPR